jgi:hypothetical protein
MAQTEDDFVEQIRNDDVPNNLMERLRQTAQESDGESFFQLAIPRYKNLLLIRYARALTFAEVDKIMRKVSKSKNPTDNLNAQCDVINSCTDSIWVRMEEDEPLVMLKTSTGDPMRWGSELLKFLDLPHVNSVRLCIQTVFGNDLAIAATQGRVFQWLQGDLDQDSGDEVSGE